MNVGEYIKFLRESKNMTQEELGKVIGVQRAAVQKWERGTVKNLKRDTIKKLADYFGVPSSNFIESTEESVSEIDRQFTEILSTLSEEDKQWLLDLIKTVIERRK